MNYSFAVYDDERSVQCIYPSIYLSSIKQSRAEQSGGIVTSAKAARSAHAHLAGVNLVTARPGLTAFRQLAGRQQQTDRGLHLRYRRTFVVVREARRFLAAIAAEYVVHERVHDRHGLARYTGVRMDLLGAPVGVDDDAGMRNSFSNEYTGPEKGRFSESAYATADQVYAFGLLAAIPPECSAVRSSGDRHAAKELVQLLVVAYRELKMSRDDPGLLVVARRVTGQLEHLGGEIFHNGGQVDGSTERRRAPHSYPSCSLRIRPTGN
ncbi:hypothetical protein EVAR_91015_1 [Eumeta japonica]|uniref:Uncharacterized protein n=1 Tax=Eumeta variegata TaxID=151549 RepID=A0A4C1SQ47_EUMVA|nr:hypothetical protein EVAR_91015_1 [Eumeta japonica]